MNKILFALCAGIVLTGFSTVGHKDSDSAYKSPDLAMFELRGNVKSITEQYYYLDSTETSIIFRLYNDGDTTISNYCIFDTEGRLTEGCDNAQDFTLIIHKTRPDVSKYPLCMIMRKI